MDSELGTDTIGKILSGRKYLMTVSENQASVEKLLSKQLHGFSQLSEALILRLLQLEERVAILESSQFLKDDGCHQATKKILVDSEERVRHLQGLLDVDPGPVSYTHLRAHETSLHLVCRRLLEKLLSPNKKLELINYSQAYPLEESILLMK